MTISAGQVRTLGNLPEAVKDATIAPHLSRAVRDVEDRSGIAAGAWGSHARAADLIEAAGCLALGYLAPVLNTMYLADATRMPRRIGDMSDFVFQQPDDWVKLEKYWNARAASALARVSESTADPVEVD